MRARGLHVRVDKCELWSTVDLDGLDIRIKRNDILGLEVLGAALGTPDFVYMKPNEIIGKKRVLFEKLDYLDHPQCALSILRHCIGPPKMVYSVRCQTPTSSVIKSLKEFDAQQREKLEYPWNCSSRRILDSSNPAHNPIRVGCSPMSRPV